MEFLGFCSWYNTTVERMNYMFRHNFFYLTPIFLLVLGDVFFFKESSDFRIFPIIFLYLVFIKQYKLKSSTTLLFSLFFLIIAHMKYIFLDPAVLLLPMVPAYERMTVWFLLVFIIGMIQKFRELK